MRVLCVATPDLLSRAKVLAKSLAAHEPSWRLEVVLVGEPDGGDDELSLISVEDELDVDVEALLARYDWQDLVAPLVPRLLLTRCLETKDSWLHLPPGAWVLGDLEPLRVAIEQRGVLLARRALSNPPDDGLEPNRHQLASAGRVASELVGADASPKSIEFLTWWIDHLDRMGQVLDGTPHPDGRSWVNLALELAPARFWTGTLDDPGCNLSVWNLHERSLTDREGTVLVNGHWPLRLIDLTGFDPMRPYRLGEISSRVRLSRDAVLRELCTRYAQELEEAGFRGTASRLVVGKMLPNGLVLDESMVTLHAVARAEGRSLGDIFSAAGADAFTDWLRAPPSAALAGVSRYLVHRVLRQRPDVAAEFPEPYGADAERFVRWWQEFGRHEVDIPPRLLPPDPAGTTSGVRPSTEAETVSGFSDEPLPPADGPVATSAEGTPLGVRVSGYLGHVLGLGAAARGYVRALAAAGVPVSTVSVPLDHLQVPQEMVSEYGRYSYADVVNDHGHAFELLCVNADELPAFIDRLGEDYFRGPRVGVWGWETTSIPVRWERAFTLVDEIWVYSRFMARNIGAVAPVPVIPLPPPVEPPREVSPIRLGVPDGFLFLFVFDYLSTIQRKNPVGLIEAFKLAFAPGEGPRLLVKTLNAPLRPLAEEEVLWAAGDRPDIHIVDQSLSAEERDALMRACDCYVSLHRSEGFGLTMAEAMAAGKPVIATGYSGNVDFMNDENSLLVDYKLTHVGPGVEIYPADGEWAEPDVQQAAALMRRVHEQRELAATIGARARSDVTTMLSPEVTGAAMRRRLQKLAAQDQRRAGVGRKTSIHS